MKKEDIFEALNDVDDELIKASEHKKKSKTWVKWASIAACLCIVAVGAFALLKPAETGGGADAGGAIDGMAGHYSVAVFPVGESLENVADAKIVSLSETEAYSFETLGAHLPAQLPEGYSFQSASLYDTTMKDGTKYYLLRVFYADGPVPEEITTEDGGVLAPDMNTWPKEFNVTVTNYKPVQEIDVYYSGDAQSLKDGGVWVSFADGVYGSFEMFELSDDNAVLVIESMD